MQKEERKHPSPTIRRLLWEVFRLRAIALRADQFEKALRKSQYSLEFNSSDLIGMALRAQLDELPLVRENEKWQDRLLDPGGKASKGHAKY